MKIGFTIAEMFYFQLTEKGRGQVIDNPLSTIKHQNTCRNLNSIPYVQYLKIGWPYCYDIVRADVAHFFFK